MAQDPSKAALLREEGKRCYFQPDADEETRAEGVRLLHEASVLGDPEAMYFLGTQILIGHLAPSDMDREEAALRYLQGASNRGLPAARALLNRMCQRRYESVIHYDRRPPAPLVDFEGKRIRIDRKGPLVPVDAKLSFDGQENLLTLRANIHFYFPDETTPDRQIFTAAVLRGFLDWEGVYEVFGGQTLRVKLELTTEDRLLDSVHVMPMTASLEGPLRVITEKATRGRRQAQLRDLTQHRRSFASMGLTAWSVYSTKFIIMQSPGGRFDDPDQLRSTAKHEFGHVLGLGDMYLCEADDLPGVEPGQYRDVDCFHLYGRNYRMVMCDANAPINGNDVEMVVLAFSKNRLQRFQPDRRGKKISEALGKGN